MSDSTDNRVAWSSDLPIWQGYSGDPPCHLCSDRPGVIYRKGHNRKNGITLEASVMYCTVCDSSSLVDEDFELWWEKRWAKCVETAEKNFEKHGIYTNVRGSGPGGWSKHSGYVKMEDGTFKPYLHVYPENDVDRYKRDLSVEHERLFTLDISDSEKFGQLYDYLKEQYKKEKSSEVSRLIEFELKRMLPYRSKPETDAVS